MAKSPTFQRSKAQLDKWREYHNPFRGLTMRKLADLLEQCDRGFYQDTMWLLRKVERRDETVRACKRRMLDEMKRLQWNIKSPDELPKGVSQASVDAQKDFLQARYDNVDNLKAALAFLGMADLRSFSHLEKHYGKDGMPNHLEIVPQWHWYRDGFYGGWKYDAKAQGMQRDSGVIIEPEHFIIREVDDPWFEIALIRALRSNLGDKDFDGFLEDYGIPFLFLIRPPGKSDGEGDKFQDVAEDVAGDGRGVLPHGSDVKGPPGSALGNAQVFKMYLDRQREAIVLAATGGLLTMLTASGSGTLAGSAHQEAWENIVAGVAKDVAETMQKQFDLPLLQEAFPGQPVLAWFEYSYPDQPEERKDVVAAIQGMTSAGFHVKREWAEEATGMELEEVEPTEEPEHRKFPQSGEDDIDAPGATIRNRFLGGAPSARDRAEALQLAENAVAGILQVEKDYLAPLTPQFERLIALAESDTASLQDFEDLALELERTYPELLDELAVPNLASAIEEAIGPAAVMGLRGSMRGQVRNYRPDQPRNKVGEWTHAGGGGGGGDNGGKAAGSSGGGGNDSKQTAEDLGWSIAGKKKSRRVLNIDGATAGLAAKGWELGDTVRQDPRLPTTYFVKHKATGKVFKKTADEIKLFLS